MHEFITLPKEVLASKGDIRDIGNEISTIRGRRGE